MISTLEIFGLPQDYLNGGGHFANWSKEKAEGKDKKKGKAKKVNKQNAKIAAIRANKGFAVK
jgi:archaeosine-15-forming tRNA-guanine transglycosylase